MAFEVKASIDSFVWRKSINDQLFARKLREEKPFDDLINFCSKIFESIALLGANSDRSKLNVNCPEVNPDLSNDEKLYSLQTELKELKDILKKKDDQAQSISELKVLVEAKEKERQESGAKLNEAQEKLLKSDKEIKRLEHQVVDLEKQLQFERDEHNAMKILCDSLSKKLTAKTKEYDDLVDLWIKKKEEDVLKINEENEKVEKLRLEKRKKELEEAAAKLKINEESVETAKSAEKNLIPVTLLPDKVLSSVDAHDGEVFALKWGACDKRYKGEILATGGSDRKIKLWQISSSNIQLKETLVGSNGGITSIDIENDNLLASSKDFTSRVWSISDGKLRRTLTGHTDGVLTVKFLGVPNKVVSGSLDRTLRIWDFNRYACTKTLYPGSTCHDLVSWKGHDVIISGHFDKKIRFWDIRSESSANDILLQGKVTSLDISPNANYLLASVRDDTLKLLDLRMNSIVKTYGADGYKIGYDTTRCAFSPDSDYIVTGSNNGSVFIWNTNTGKVEKILKNHHTSAILACAWNLNGTILASCDRNKKVVFWST